MRGTLVETQRRVSRLNAEALVGRQNARERDLPPGLNHYQTPKYPSDASFGAVFVPFSRFMKRTLSRHPGQAALAASHGDPSQTTTMSSIAVALEPGKFRRDHIPIEASVACLPGEGSFAGVPTVSHFHTTRLRDDDPLRFGQV